MPSGRRWFPTIADPLYVAQLRRWAREDPEMVRRYIGVLVGVHSHAAFLNMPDDQFWQVWAAVGELRRNRGDVGGFLRAIVGHPTRDDELDELAELMQPDAPCRPTGFFRPKRYQPRGHR